MKARISPDTGLWEYSDTGQLRKGWLQFVNVPRPTFDPVTQEVDKLDPTPVGDTAVETWLVRPKTQEELDADADKAERLFVKGLIVDIAAGTGSNVERIQRVERATKFLLRDYLQGV